MDPETDLGPLATEQILQGVQDQVEKSITAGAKLLTGGNRVQGPGFFYEPTVLVDVPKDSPAYREEVFGPIAAVFRVGDVHEAINLANDTIFGLGASAWTSDRKEQKLVEHATLNNSPNALMGPSLSGNGNLIAFSAWSRPGGEGDQIAVENRRFTRPEQPNR